MADRLTGLGQQIDDYEVQNNVVGVSSAYQTMLDAIAGAKTIQAYFGDLSIKYEKLIYKDDIIATVDDYLCQKLCTVLKMPTNYILKLSRDMQASNFNYWFERFSEKEVEIVYKDGEVLSISDLIEIKLLHIFKILHEDCTAGKIFRTINQTNSIIFDIYFDTVEYKTAKEIYYGGIRIVYKHGLNAPDISPIFVNTCSCAIIECASYLEKLVIKNLSYNDILRAIQNQINDTADALPKLFHVFNEISSNEIKNPHRRVALYCREHNIPERVRGYVLDMFDETYQDVSNVESLILLFAVMGYTSEIKQSSERKLQQLAGDIIMQAKAEHRCEKCDSTVNQD